MFSVMMTLIAFFVVLIGLYLFWVISSLSFFKSSQKKVSVYECGFTAKTFSRLPFSLRFFFLLLLFIVFDVELAFVAQLPFQKELFFKKRLLYEIFFVLLILGLVEEWRRGMLSWTH